MVNKSLNILIVASWYPNDAQPTNGSFVEEQVQMLLREGHSVTVLHPFLTGTFMSSLLQKDLQQRDLFNGVQVIRVGVSPVLPGFRVLAYKKLFNACVKTCSKYNINLSEFDVIHSHALFMGGYIAMRLGKKFGKLFFHTEHTSGLIFNPKQYSKQDVEILKSVYSAAVNVFFVSRFALDKTLAQYGIIADDKFSVLSNIVDDSFFDRSISENNVEPFCYLIICNLIPLKRVDLLLNSWVDLIKKYPKSKLTIAGDGPERSRLVDLTEELKISDLVTFLPRLNRNEVKEQIRRHHVLVSTSALETFGLTVAEAQAMGKPVVVTDSGGVRDIVEADTGIITGDSPEDFSIGLVKIQRIYSSFNPEYIREKAVQKFSTNVISEKLISNYVEKLITDK